MQNQMEHLYAKTSGTGNSDTTKWYPLYLVYTMSSGSGFRTFIEIATPATWATSPALPTCLSQKTSPSPKLNTR